MTETQLDKFLADSRRATRNARTAAETVVRGGEMLQAAGDVIAARLEILAAGMADPARADLTEMALMGTEKSEALTESAATLTRNLGEAGERLSRATFDEMGRAGKAATAMASAPTAQAFAHAQFDYAMGFWGRMTGQMLTLNTELLKAQAEALKPIHDAAVANAKRLKK